jgi:hypothetical protein
LSPAVSATAAANVGTPMSCQSTVFLRKGMRIRCNIPNSTGEVPVDAARQRWGAASLSTCTIIQDAPTADVQTWRCSVTTDELSHAWRLAGNPYTARASLTKDGRGRSKVGAAQLYDVANVRAC